MKNTKSILERKVAVINSCFNWKKGDNGFVEVESYRPGAQRLYRLTTHRGSCNLSDLNTLSTTIEFADGCLAGILFNTPKYKEMI